MSPTREAGAGEARAAGSAPVAGLLEPAPLDAAESLAADFLAGRDSCLRLFPSTAVRGSRPVGRPARIPPSAFGAATPAARRKLERILAGEGVLVTTGQQPLLLLGPLFVLYKAATAMEEARRIEERSGEPALACFWIASDDADWEEVGVTHVLGRDNRLEEIRIDPPPGREGASVGPSPLPGSIGETVERFLAALGESEFSPACAALVRRACQPGTTFAESFARLLEGVFEGRELAWLDSSSPAVREASRPLLERVLRAGTKAEDAVRRAARAVEAAGYEPRLGAREGALSVFLDADRRERLYAAGNGRLRIGREGPERGLEELLAAAGRPSRLSPAASLRPVLESWLLPVGASVLGPGEIAYWAQLGGVFDLADVAMPRIRPRGAWWIVEAKVRKVLDKLGAAPAELADGGEALRRRVVEETRPAAVADALAFFRSESLAALERVEEAVDAALPGIRASVGKTRAALLDVLDELERAVDGRVRERQEILLTQLRKAAANLFPAGRSQERIVSPFSYLARYGPALLRAIEGAEREAKPPPGSHVAGPEAPA